MPSPLVFDSGPPWNSSGEGSSEDSSYLEEHNSNKILLDDYEEQDGAGFEEELQDFKDDATAHSMLPKERSTTFASRISSKSPKKTIINTEDVEYLSLGLSQTMITEDLNYSITYVLPWRHKTSKDGSKDIFQNYF